MPATDADYEALGLRRPATQSEARAAFRKLALRLHPDKNGGCREAEARFKRVVVAYRAVLDEAPQQPPPPHHHQHHQCVRAMGDALRSVLVWLLVASTSAPEDIGVEIEVSLADACAARVKRLQIAVMRRAAPGWSELRKASQLLYLRVDAACAAPSGSVHRFPGAGDDPVFPTGRRGDVVVTVRLLRHPTFRPDTVYSSMDLHAEVPVTPRDYYYGTTACIEHDDGGPPVVASYLGRSGRRVHVEKNRGLPDVVSGTRGDLYVFFELRMPRLDDALLSSPRVKQAFDDIFGAVRPPEGSDCWAQ